MIAFDSEFRKIAKAYALGYWDGRAHGVCERNMDQFETDELLAYHMAFAAGVKDYEEQDATGGEAAA